MTFERGWRNDLVVSFCVAKVRILLASIEQARQLTNTCNSTLKGSDPLFVLFAYTCACTYVHTHTCIMYTCIDTKAHTHIIKKFKIEKYQKLFTSMSWHTDMSWELGTVCDEEITWCWAWWHTPLIPGIQGDRGRQTSVSPRQVLST